MASQYHIALLRGVNVGGKNRVPMADLRAMFAEAGCHESRTYIQSGNVVFKAAAAAARSVPARVEAMLAERLGIHSPVVTRTAAELAAVAERFRQEAVFEDARANPASVSVMFLAAKPPKANAAALDPDRSPGDSFVLIGREVYLHLPNGAARSKLTNAYFDKTLGTVSTVRSRRTVEKLLEMCAG